MQWPKKINRNSRQESASFTHKANFVHVLLIFFILGSLLFAESVLAQAQIYSKDGVMAALTTRLIGHVTWETEVDASYIRVAFLGEDDGYYSQLKVVMDGRVLKGRKIQLSKIKTLDNMESYQVLIVAKETALSFSEIALKVRRTNTLVISEVSQDQIYIMINFHQLKGNRVSFEVNMANIILEHLSIDDDVLLLGGTVLDVVRLYRKVERSFANLQDKLQKIQLESNIENAALEQSQRQLQEAKTLLASTVSDLSIVNMQLKAQGAIVLKQEAEIQSRQRDLQQAILSSEKNQNLLTKQSNVLEKQSIALEEQKRKLKNQQANVRNNKRQLMLQQKMLDSQASNLNIQSNKIAQQQNLLVIVGLILLVFILLLFGLYRISQDRKRMSLELKRKSMSLEDDVRQRTAAAIESERHFRALSELSPVGVFQTDSEGNCRYVNERWCEYSSISREMAMGKGWISVLHPDDRSQLSSNWHKDLEAEKILNSTHRYTNSGGDIRWLLGRCSAEYDADGVLQGFIGTVTDISDQRRLEEQIRRTQKMDALGQLTGGIAHDYNNMLMIISGYTELLGFELSEKGEAIESVEKIAHACSRAAELTQKLLNFSKDTRSNAKLVDINSQIEDQKTMLEKVLTPRIQLNLDFDKNIWPVWIDDGDFEDALVNMCINAMHAMEGVGTLTICTRNCQLVGVEATKLHIAAGEYVKVELIDTGIGMNEETLIKLFDPFFSTKGSKGTGLGLTQVYKFIERSKGSIDITSKVAEGTKISIFFPRHSDVDKSENMTQLEHNTDLSGNELVLIVDDEEELLQIASAMLKKEGYQTMTASSGNEALEILKRTSVDLMLSDVIMPEMDGYQLADAVRYDFPNLKIQLVSGYTDKTQGNQLHQDLLDKPYSANSLLQAVRKALDCESEW